MSTPQVGDPLPTIEVTLTRADLVRYAGASLDFNPIHWNERFAREVGLPDVIAHGMLTMAIAGRVVSDWGGELVDYSARFTRPVVVPDDDKGALVEVSGKVGAVNDDGTVRIDLTAKFDGKTVLGKPVAVIRPRS
ncbi:MaoC like domain-containing protein [Actinokineospora alba]|uniref:MaoC like domain-containing protein n=1 Tax=Actinokineospora alba TaxID=504798 RepID=A0A1H0V959_9PSEU|nr:MaoC family dehydratase [Actinokineospora alba]TDP65563.1 MaoC dehydratase-like protein [Actinokineospora alba]SDH65377.1 MaoC like domain-containing protein [Actinokineospora alba]SDP75072.1 MaoC like domain-containing protein [Actinokineospora alba]